MCRLGMLDMNPRMEKCTKKTPHTFMLCYPVVKQINQELQNENTGNDI